MDNSISDMLGDEAAPETVVEQPEAIVEAEPATDERPRGPDGKFISKEPTGVEPHDAEPVPPTDRLPQAEYAALRDERQKRQQLEERLRQYDEYYANQQAQQRQPQAPQSPPDMFEDPDGFKEHLRNEILQELQPTLNQHRSLTRAEMSEIAARQKFEDYDETVEVFKEAMAANPFLLTQLQQAADPATYAYNAGKQYGQAKAYGSEAPPSRETIEAEIRAQILAEVGLDRPKAPSTFAGDRSVGARSGPSWSGPLPLGDMLK